MALFNKVLCLRRAQYLYRNIRKNSVYARKGFRNFENWKEKFSNILTEPSNVSKETWESMRNFALESTTENKEIVDAFLLEVFKMEDCPDAGISYYKFLQNNNYNISTTIETNYLALYDKKKVITDADKAYISYLCESIPKKHGLLSVFQVNIIVSSLCKINKWREAIEIINQFEAIEPFGLTYAYDQLVVCLLKNNESELADKYLATGMNKCYEFKKAYFTYLECYLNNRDTFNERIEKLFLLWRKYGVKPNDDVISAFKTICNKVGWSAQLSSMSGSQCTACRQIVEETPLSENEFKRLYEAIEKNVITNNKYRVSDPNEWDYFTKFMNRHKPYDIVVDGLNSMMAFPGAMKTCISVLEKLKSDGKKILIIGRKHVKRMPKISRLLKTGDYFLVNDLSKDDAFILYALFLSGNGTSIISRDLLRQHKFTFHDNELNVLFKRWQKLHQYVFNNSGCLWKLDSVRPIDSFAQKKGNCWHIPYIDPSVHLKKTPNCGTCWACFNMHP